jgi:DnaK suppressor protein
MASRAPTHPADEATDEHGRALAKQLAETERNLIREIDEALRRIEQGTYGLCDEGGEPIAIERLRARPWTRRCLKHAEETE